MIRAPKTKAPEVIAPPKQELIPAENSLQIPAIDIWNKDSPRSLINLLPRKIAQRFEDMRFEHPELFDIGEDELREIFKEKKRKVSTTENQMRLRLWYEFSLCQENPDFDLVLSRVTSGLCSETTFHRYLTSAEAIAWLACPPLSYEVHVDELLNFGAAKMREILSLEAKDPVSQKVDTKLLKLQFEIYLNAEARKFGAIPQVTKNMHLHGKVPGTPKDLEDRSELSMQKKIEELKERQRRALNPPPKGVPSVDRPILGPDDV